MKKFARRVCGLALSLGMLCTSAIPVFATEETGWGTYNGQSCGTKDVCEDFYIYSETGSTSDYYLYSTVTFYYRTSERGAIDGGSIKSSKNPKFSNVSFNSNIMLAYAKYYHYMSEYLAVYEEVFA